MTILTVATTCCIAFADVAQLRIAWGEADNTEREELRSLELERIGSSHFRAVVRKSDIPADATTVSIVVPFMTARRGDEGWWMQARGTYGKFDKADGRYVGDADRGERRPRGPELRYAAIADE